MGLGLKMLGKNSNSTHFKAHFPDIPAWILTPHVAVRHLTQKRDVFVKHTKIIQANMSDTDRQIEQQKSCCDHRLVWLLVPKTSMYYPQVI